VRVLSRARLVDAGRRDGPLAAKRRPSLVGKEQPALGTSVGPAPDCRQRAGGLRSVLGCGALPVLARRARENAQTLPRKITAPGWELAPIAFSDAEGALNYDPCADHWADLNAVFTPFGGCQPGVKVLVWYQQRGAFRGDSGSPAGRLPAPPDAGHHFWP
jgi:hypothetical protein